LKLSVKTALFILVASVIAIFGQTVFFSFTNWDDPAYITQNTVIKTFDLNFIRAIFTEPMHGHYHPLTWISLAFDYQLFGLKAWGFHIHNLLLHLINTILVFYLARNLKDDIRIAFFCSLLFAVHPFANESVSWITERKNLLFTLFYIAAFISYIRYYKTKSKLHYITGIVFFILSLLSKGSAITLPIILMFWLMYHSLFSKKEMIKLLPFFLLAVIFSWLAIKAQQPLLNQVTVKLPFWDSFLYSSWAFGLYITKAFIPFHLAAFHPIFIGDIPIYYFLGFVVLIVYIVLIIHSFRQHNVDLFFGLSFFLVNIVLFLKVFEAYASSYFMAERYTYLAYIGLYFAFFSWFFNNIKKNTGLYLMILWIVIVSFQSFQYAKTWKNSLSLWSNVLKIYPTSNVALLNYGNALRQDKQYIKAIEYYNKIKDNGDIYTKMLENRAYAYYQMNNWDNAANDYALLLEKYPERKDIKQIIAGMLIQQGNVQLAYHQLQFLLKQDSTFCDAWNSLGNYYTQTNSMDSALLAYEKAINCSPKALYYYNRATLLSMNNKLEAAIIDFNKALSLDSSHSEYYVNRAINYFKLKNFSLSLNDFNNAIRLNPVNVDYYLNRSNVFMALNLWNNAIDDLNKALKLNPNNGDIYARRSFVLKKMGLNDKACNDIKMALKLGYKKYESLENEMCK